MNEPCKAAVEAAETIVSIFPELNNAPNRGYMVQYYAAIIHKNDLEALREHLHRLCGRCVVLQEDNDD